MTPSSPDPTRPFYPIDDPEHPAPRDGTKIELRSNKYPAPQGPMICWFDDTDTNWPWRFNDGTETSDGVSANWPTHWRPILDAEAGPVPTNGVAWGNCSPPPAQMIAFFQAHRACHSAEHDPINGKIHGYCLVCGVPWPCEYAKPDILAAALTRAEKA